MRAMFRRPRCGAAGFSAVPRRRHAAVVGGSLAGMLAARVLSDHFDTVTQLERDRFPETPAARKGLPQGRHAHVLLANRAGYVSAGVTYGYPDGNHAWFRSVVLCPVCVKALSVFEVVKLLDNSALCSGLLVDE